MAAKPVDGALVTPGRSGALPQPTPWCYQPQFEAACGESTRCHGLSPVLPMPPIVIDVAKADDRRDVVHRAVEALALGAVVSLATETVYGLACRADLPKAVQRLLDVKGRPREC